MRKTATETAPDDTQRRYPPHAVSLEPSDCPWIVFRRTDAGHTFDGNSSAVEVTEIPSFTDNPPPPPSTFLHPTIIPPVWQYTRANHHNIPIWSQNRYKNRYKQQSHESPRPWVSEALVGINWVLLFLVSFSGLWCCRNVSPLLALAACRRRLVPVSYSQLSILRLCDHFWVSTCCGLVIGGNGDGDG
ncbi:uncharacterized protein YALI1_E21779g [Yarrowia lipolytica]|uniref:Uncharacterized protein n=1 Tax=Yarrowia lipolytica TaxID=4952 RepID=A0A1D8NIX7_YARLL|nr:hypothetical protein YALI1_E21779g [Yarrowia lipolytica]